MSSEICSVTIIKAINLDHIGIHGAGGCQDVRRFLCMVCWRSVCWCFGCADDVDEIIAKNRQGRHALVGAGICDECACAFETGEVVEQAHG